MKKPYTNLQPTTKTAKCLFALSLPCLAASKTITFSACLENIETSLLLEIPNITNEMSQPLFKYYNHEKDRLFIDFPIYLFFPYCKGTNYF
ncbi:MAG: hypothetical protein DHS20C18_30160 [Saprospiraceae bacterium]|nr:MAG: hypothetical protein DHS20C18_30160 [Saprospiraceae bacterium]